MSTDKDSSKVAAACIDRWKGHLRLLQADGPSMDHDHRKEIGRDMANLARRFVDGNISIEQFRLEFHRNTLRKWDSFGVGGASGGMLLNVAVKYINDRATLTEALQTVMNAPIDVQHGRKILSDYVQYLRSRITNQELTANLAGINRVPFLVSVFWYVQSPDQCPIFYPTTRKVFADKKLFQSTGDVVADYFHFCQTHNALRDALGI